MKIEVSHLSRRFGRTLALDDVSFTLEKNGICGFVGPNGAGKTTAIQIMAGLDEPQSGNVFCDGVSMVDYPEKVRARIGYMPDFLPDCSDITVADYLDFYGRAFGFSGAKLDSTLDRVKKLTSLSGMNDKKLNQLSKGMKQRVSLARILVHNPDFLLLDEPAAGLDPRARIELRDILKQLAAEGKMIFLSSHILTELEDLCDSVVIIEKGRLVRSGRLDELGKADAELAAEILLTYGDAEKAAAAQKYFASSEKVASAVCSGRACVKVVLNGGAAAVDGFMAAVFATGFAPDAFRRGSSRADLEELFLKSTKNEVQ